MSQNRAIIFAAVTTAVAAASLLFADTGLVWLRLLFGIPFVLLLPGHAVMLFVDPEGRLGGYEWFAFSVGTSIALTTLLGMGLASSSVGLTRDGMVMALTAATLLTLFAATVRTFSRPQRRLMPIRRSPIQRALFNLMALAVCTLLVVMVSISGASTSDAGHVVQLWGLPNQSDASIRIGVNNVNAVSQHYQLTITQAGRLISEQEMDLPPGTGRIFEVKKSATWTNSAPVAAELTDIGGLAPPRSISVWMAE